MVYPWKVPCDLPYLRKSQHQGLWHSQSAQKDGLTLIITWFHMNISRVKNVYTMTALQKVRQKQPCIYTEAAKSMRYWQEHQINWSRKLHQLVLPVQDGCAIGNAVEKATPQSKNSAGIRWNDSISQSLLPKNSWPPFPQALHHREIIIHTASL